MKTVKSLLDIVCIILAFSAVMDSILWLTIAYTVPCWTIAAMCIGVIMLVQVIKKEVLSEKSKNTKAELVRSELDQR